MNHGDEEDIPFTRRGFLTTAIALTSSAFGAGGAIAQATENKAEYKIGLPLEKQWSTDFTGFGGIGTPRVTLGTIADGVLYLKLDSTNRDSAKLVAHDIEANSGIWETTADDYVSPPIIIDGTLLVSVLSDLKAYSALEEPDSTLWEHEATMDIVSWPKRIKDKFVVPEYNAEPRDSGDNDYSYEQGRLALYDPDGTQQWAVEGEYIEYPYSYDDSIIHIEGKQYRADDEYHVSSGRVVSRDFETGDKQWESSDFDIWNIRPTRSETILTHSRNDAIRGIDSDSGTVDWTVETGIGVKDFDAGPSNVYIGVGNDLQAIDYTTGSRRWTRTELSPFDINYYGGLLFVGADGGNFYALDAATGKTVWDAAHPNGVGYLRILDGNLYTFSQNRVSVFAGKRGEAIAALENSRSTEGLGSISSVVANLLGRDRALSRAETDIENQQYESALDEVTNATLQKQSVEATAALISSGIVYGGARNTGTRIQKRRLQSWLHQSDELYPLQSGALRGLSPDNIIQQGKEAEEELDHIRWGCSLLSLVSQSDDYSGVIKKLARVNNQHEDLLALSKDLAEFEDHIPVQKWKSQFVETVDSDLNRLEELLRLGNQAVRLTESYHRVQQSNAEERLNLATLDSLIQSTQSPTSENQHPIEYIEIALQAVETFTTAHSELTQYDLSTVENNLQDSIDVRHTDYSTAEADLGNIEELLSLAMESETDRKSTDFTHSDLSSMDIQGWIHTALRTVSTDEMEEIRNTIRNLKHGVWKTEHLHAYSPYEFEVLISDLYKDLGYQTQVTTEGTDGGVDVIAESPNETLIIQVKQYTNNNIGRPTVQQTAGVRDQFGADKAIVITSSDFTGTAEEASRDFGHRMELIDGRSLKNMLSQSSLIPPGENVRVANKQPQQRQ
ncbi:hypothetical protein EGH24_12335 [Halonotius terrestris]|uniref:Outer membrane protein assembly factor BamB, contains PQQ-like beta-propeller repeat n=1 Tax=Halonotius terrestris TaxID=2487750 RepID=A0A8J8PB65_9EURY|nr:restriction endonuclease [Halonotius terrestris]TQQ79173.1 hypothetical protein EGH24_12335 [Halonotius terrestris]